MKKPKRFTSMRVLDTASPDTRAKETARYSLQILV